MWSGEGMKERRMKAHCGGMGSGGRDLRERIREAEEREKEEEKKESENERGKVGESCLHRNK